MTTCCTPHPGWRGVDLHGQRSSAPWAGTWDERGNGGRLRLPDAGAGTRPAPSRRRLVRADRAGAPSPAAAWSAWSRSARTRCATPRDLDARPLPGAVIRICNEARLCNESDQLFGNSEALRSMTAQAKRAVSLNERALDGGDAPPLAGLGSRSTASWSRPHAGDAPVPLPPRARHRCVSAALAVLDKPGGSLTPVDARLSHPSSALLLSAGFLALHALATGARRRRSRFRIVRRLRPRPLPRRAPRGGVDQPHRWPAAPACCCATVTLLVRRDRADGRCGRRPAPAPAPAAAAPRPPEEAVLPITALAVVVVLLFGDRVWRTPEDLVAADRARAGDRGGARGRRGDDRRGRQPGAGHLSRWEWHRSTTAAFATTAPGTRAEYEVHAVPRRRCSRSDLPRGDAGTQIGRWDGRPTGGPRRAPTRGAKSIRRPPDDLLYVTVQRPTS